MQRLLTIAQSIPAATVPLKRWHLACLDTTAGGATFLSYLAITNSSTSAMAFTIASIGLLVVGAIIATK